YPATQYFGNLALTAYRGDLRVMGYLMNPANVKRAYDAVRQGKSKDFWRDEGFPTRTQMMNDRLGISGIPESRDVNRGRDIGSQGDKHTGQATLEKLGPVGKVASKSLGFQWTRDAGAAMDVLYREGIEYVQTQRNLRNK